MPLQPSLIRSTVIISLCAALLVPTFPRSATATSTEVVTLKIGQPSIWSLGQAHYLLAQMHLRNEGLSTRLPTENDLDPNRANAMRLEVVRSLLGIEAQFDQSIAKQNQIALQRFQEEEARREGARVLLEARRAERTRLNGEILALEERIVSLEVEDTVATATRGEDTPPSEQDLRRKQEIAVLKVQRDSKKADRDRLDAEITSLTTTVTTAPAAPTLATPSVSSTAGTLPSSDALKKFTEKALDDATTPSLSASTTLDNFVGMQYEIISKQLTLLRDEVGPDERVIFLELPTSIYTVDKRANNYIAQVEWEVAHYYDREPSKEVQREVIMESLLEQGRSECDRYETLHGIAGLNVLSDAGLDRMQKATKMTRCAALKASFANPETAQQYSGDGNAESGESESESQYPITLDMLLRDSDRAEKSSRGFKETAAGKQFDVRALEIIPRQSALNINKYHASVRNWSFLGILKLLSGFGAKVDYQQQREMYEKFLQQHAFASGFGKGLQTFGWTFGPLPGSKRIEPGQRNTYAVLVVPRNTLALELKATGRVFKRRQSPDKGEIVGSETFFMRVPGEATQRFWIDGVSYTPVAKGQPVTVLLEGSYFSPQLGVLVNGKPLDRAISIAKHQASSPGQGVQGTHEIVNSREIVLSFSMGPDFVGTPIITLVTPERSTTINSFKLAFNHHPSPRLSLKEQSLREPMFREGFSLEKEVEQLPKEGEFMRARLRGIGLLPQADITVNGVPFDSRVDTLDAVKKRVTEGKLDEPFAFQESSRSYLLFFKDPGADNWIVRYRQRTRQGFEQDEFKQKINPAFELKLRHYRPGRPAEADLKLVLPNGATEVEVALDDPQAPMVPGVRGCQKPKTNHDRSILIKCLVPQAVGAPERDRITIRTAFKGKDGKPVERFEDVDLPIRPRIVTIRNPRTNKAAGFASEDATVIIAGANLQGVTTVLFGEKEAKLLSSGNPEVLLVKVPKAEVAKGQESQVAVLLKTATHEVPAGSYLFVGEPLPKE